jgi:hypothetical protein
MTFQYHTGCGSVFVTITVDGSGNPVEAFINIGKSGGCTQAFAETVGKMTSIGLRCGIGVDEIIAQYSGIQCNGGSWDDGVRVTSCSGAVSLALKEIVSGLGARLAGLMSGSAQQVAKHPDLTDDEVAEQVAQLRAERDKLEDEVGS